MRQAELLREIENEARIEAEYFAPDPFEDWVMPQAVADALSRKGKRKPLPFVPKSLPTRRRAA